MAEITENFSHSELKQFSLNDKGSKGFTPQL